ncbi:Uncharacterised protein [Vibrio cholerae]|nr:Uncharacterised protein [Vibrio cholerae]
MNLDVILTFAKIKTQYMMQLGYSNPIHLGHMMNQAHHSLHTHLIELWHRPYFQHLRLSNTERYLD